MHLPTDSNPDLFRFSGSACERFKHAVRLSHSQPALEMTAPEALLALGTTTDFDGDEPLKAPVIALEAVGVRGQRATSATATDTSHAGQLGAVPRNGHA